MKSDRELLELAAKAAGMLVLKHPWKNDDGWFFCEIHGEPAMHFRYAANPHAHVNPWMPLTDDGDALRLAVKLRIKFRYNEELGQALAWRGGALELDDNRANIEDSGGDEYDCSRIAIVRAAASIGEQMP